MKKVSALLIQRLHNNHVKLFGQFENGEMFILCSSDLPNKKRDLYEAMIEVGAQPNNQTLLQSVWNCLDRGGWEKARMA